MRSAGLASGCRAEQKRVGLLDDGLTVSCVATRMSWLRRVQRCGKVGEARSTTGEGSVGNGMSVGWWESGGEVEGKV